MKSGPAASNLKRLSLSLLPASLLAALFFQLIVFAVVNEPDEFWHLWSGRLIDQTGKVTRSDPACILTGNYDWVNLSWLGQLINYRSYLTFGLAGPATISAWLSAIILICHFVRLQNIKPPLPLLFLSTALIFYAIYYDYSSRPQIYSFGLLALLSVLLHRSGDEKTIGAAPAAAAAVIMLIWNNLHGGAIYGYALLGCDAAGSAAAALYRGGTILNKRSLRIAFAAAAGLCGFVFHPHGFDALGHMLTYSGSMHQVFYQNITELQPIDLFTLQGSLYLILLIVLAVSAAAARSAGSLREALATALFALLAFKVRRLFLPLVIVGAPYAVETMIRALRRHNPNNAPAAGSKLFAPVSAASALLLCGMLIYWSAAIVPSRTPERAPGASRSLLIDRQSFPVEIAEAIRDIPLNGLIFNNYGSGGYLGWVLYPPQHRIMIDGRGDLHSFGNGYERYLSVSAAEPGYAAELDALKIDLVVLLNDAPLAAALRDNPDWQLKLDDPPYILFQRREQRP